jgi:hypothetical protein
MARLAEETVVSGSRTHLVVSVLPRDLPGTVRVMVTGGPVAFESGASSQKEVASGVADFPLFAKPGGKGPFGVSWEFDPKDLLVDPGELLVKGLKALNDLTIALREKNGTKPLPPGMTPAGVGAKREDPPKKEDPPKDPEPRKPGDTTATDNGWTPFKDDDGRTGKMEIKDDGRGNRRVVKVYDDHGNTLITETTVGKTKTVKIDDTRTTDGVKRNTVETLEYVMDEKGEWVLDKGERKTWKIGPGNEKTLEGTSTYNKKTKRWS